MVKRHHRSVSVHRCRLNVGETPLSLSCAISDFDMSQALCFLLVSTTGKNRSQTLSEGVMDES